MIRFSQEFADDIGMDGVRKMILAYDKGWVGRSETLRIGMACDDFTQNMLTAMVIMMKVPRLVAPKNRRKNKLSNRKLNRRR